MIMVVTRGGILNPTKNSQIEDDAIIKSLETESSENVVHNNDDLYKVVEDCELLR